ncbi:MAG: type I DNA topoisomerase [Clostridia bacterium]|nr:type I DNA topoisomerase [Clostridia bacterium]
MSKLVIVESPAKAKTIKKYLGSGYEVLASFGHIRDLPEKKMSVDIEHGFAPQYIEMPGKEEIIKKLREAALDSEMVYLATDPDREGEAISWHLAGVLSLDETAKNRVTFNEITKSGIKTGMENPRSIDMKLVNAQQCRRILDRVVGYKLSPFLWKKVQRGLSAGRVQSVAVRLVVDREEQIKAFKPEEYWTIDALFSNMGAKKTFPAKLVSTPDSKKAEIKDSVSANDVLERLDGAKYVITSVKKGIRRKQPAPPFITSTLQQDASRKLNMTGKRTMRVAQELYEGVEIEGIGATGLITYMRTDSLRISEEARAAGNKYILENYGKDYLPEKPRYFKTSANAQDGHEAIRPTDPFLTPARVRSSLTTDQYRVYKLIWERFTASLMANCIQDTVTADITANECVFRASGFTVRFDGYTLLYEEGKDTEDEKTTALPVLKENDEVQLRDLKANQHFTLPPARYTEASLIEAFKENGIGRPSTYATTISTILSREYIEREKKSLKPTALGEVTTGLMKDMFKDIVDVKFTASMEKDLDLVAEGERDYIKILEQFYGPFAASLDAAEKKMQGKKAKLPEVDSGEVCEKCGKPMVIKNGRFGKFLACSGYPACKTTKAITVECKGTCPVCGGKMLERKSKRGYKYFGCEKYPECTFMTWNEPISDTCPKCGKTLFKKRGGIILCENEGCGYETKATRTQKAKTEEE